MPRKRHKPEEIVAKLRQVDVLTSQGQSVAVCATPTGSDGHAHAGAETDAKLTLPMDHPAGAGHGPGLNLPVDVISGMDVLSETGEMIGEVNHVLADRAGDVLVVIGLDQLSVVGDQLETSLSPDEIELLPRWKNGMRIGL